LLIRIFFREVEVTGIEHLPKEGGGLLVSWHPNGMIDPGLIMSQFPRQVVFGARSGLFRYPVLGMAMRAVGTVPIYRASDAENADPAARREANSKSLDALAAVVANGSFSCLFPEGHSHDAPHLQHIKTGAARFYFRARELSKEGAPPPVIIPVGLHYDHKRGFRSNALVSFHPPIELDEALACLGPPRDGDDSGEAAPDGDRLVLLTARIERVLHDVVHATENWELHYLMHRARKLVRAERAHRAGANPGRSDMEERTLGFARVWKGYYERLETHPEQVAAVLTRIREYDQDLRALALNDHELDRSPKLLRPKIALYLALQVLLVFILLPPVLLVGYAVNLFPLVGLWAVSRALSKKRKDEASIKLMFGVVAFPAAWATAAVLAAVGHERLHAIWPTIPDTPVLAGGVVVLFGIVGGLVALPYSRLVQETLRAIRVRLTRARRSDAVKRLRRERAGLFEAVVGLAEGLELPGHVSASGRIVTE
jgi:1-acyl-sn-glycerol-3-phosphate acyltransferase